MKPYIFILIASVALLSSCDDDDSVSSRDVSTSRMYATFQIIADGGDEIFAQAQLTLDVPPENSDQTDTYIILEGGDELWFSAGESIDNIDFDSGDVFGEFENFSEKHTRFNGTRTLSDVYNFLFDFLIFNRIGTSYSAQLPQAGDEEYHIALLRDDALSATESVVRLADNFTMTSPSAGSSFSRSRDDIFVEWTNLDSDVSVQLEVNITCVDGGFASYSETFDSDSGSAVIFSGELDDDDLEGTCSATLNLRKVSVGQFDSSFIGGAVNAYQIRSVAFLLEE